VKSDTNGYLWALEYKYKGKLYGYNLVLDAFTLKDAEFEIMDLIKLGYLQPSTRILGMVKEEGDGDEYLEALLGGEDVRD